LIFHWRSVSWLTDLNAALLKQFLNVTLAQTEPVIKPESVLDDAQRKAVAIRLTIRHGRPPYRN